MRCLVGIDDTDSSRGYCTTYLSYRIAKDLAPHVTVLPYPRLVRLNPNVPFKTRGNAAVCLQVEARDPDGAFDAICQKVREVSDVRGGANPGVAFLEREAAPLTLGALYLEALSGMVNPHRARRLLKEAGARTFELGNGMGVVGAGSALGFDDKSDHTYELVAYRRKDAWGTPRLIDSASVREMEEETFPHTFNSYDHQKRKVLIAPHGPDPVFAGVRGDSPDTVIQAFKLLRYEEQLDGYMVYVSNQHTDAHLQGKLEWKSYASGWLEGVVASPRTGVGGHVYFRLRTKGGIFDCGVYEPTGDLRRVARMLQDGDLVRAYGGVRRPSKRHPKILNVEKLDVLRLASKESRLETGTYISSPRANRHLTKPLVRYGRRSQDASRAVPNWLSGGVRRLPVPV